MSLAYFSTQISTQYLKIENYKRQMLT